MAIQALNTIKNWFRKGLKPSQNQFWDTWDSFRHKFEKVPMEDIENLESVLDTKAEKTDLEDHKNDQNAHLDLFDLKENKNEKGTAGGYVPLDEFSKIAHQYLNIIDNLTSGGTTSLLSAEQGMLLQKQLNVINLLLKSDNPDMDTIQKIVDTIEEIQLSLDTILVNDLTTGGTTKALTAEMGKILQNNKEDKSQKGIAGGYAPLNEVTKIASEYLLLIDDLITGGSESILTAEQGKVLQNQINDINTLLQSDNVDLDTIQEIVDAIEQVQISLDTILVNDLTTGGVTKALTAEMGKLLNETKLTATIATDAETQITTAVTEDNKVVSRLKLFNWWQWILSKSQTVSGIWNFINGFKVEKIISDTTYSTQMLYDRFISQYVRIDGTFKWEFYNGGVRYTHSSGFSTNLSAYLPSKYNFIVLPDKSGTIALNKDFVITAQGTTTDAPLIIPNGTLTTIPQNGSIERDSNGNLYHTINNGRYKLLDSRDSESYLRSTWRSTFEYNTSLMTYISDIKKQMNSSIQQAFGGNESGTYLFKFIDKYDITNLVSNDQVSAKSVLFECYLKGINCKFSGNEYLKLYSVLNTDLKTMSYIRNLEIPLKITQHSIESKTCSSLMFSQFTYDSLGNRMSEVFEQSFLQSLTYTGNYGDLKISDANILIEYRVSTIYTDSNNENGKNGLIVPEYRNFSTLIIKL